MRRSRILVAVALVVAAVAAMIWAPPAGALAPAGGGFFWQSPQPFGGDIYGLTFADATHVWGIAEGNASGDSRLAVSADGGFTWTRVDPGSRGSIWGLTFPDALHGRAMSSWWDDATQTSHAALLLTDDGGATWTSRDIVQNRFDAYDAGFATAGRGWVIGNGWDSATKSWWGTVLVTTDAGLTWQRSVVPAHWVDALTVIDATHLWMTGGQRAILTSSDGGTTWARHSLGVGAYLDELDPVDATHAWAIAEGRPFDGNGAILQTSDGGATWSIANMLGDARGTLTAASPTEAWASMEDWRTGDATTWVQHTTDGGQTWSRSYVGPYGPGSLTRGPGGVMLGAGAGVWRSPDAGATWLHVVGDDLGFWLNDICAVGPTDLWSVGETTPDAGFSWGLDNGFGLLRHSVDGIHWSDVKLPSGAPLTTIDFSDTQHGWAAGGSYDSPSAPAGRVLRTTDGGATWTRLATADQLEFGDIAAIGAQSAVGPVDDLSNGDTAIAMTTDGGDTWQQTIRPNSEYVRRVAALSAEHLLVAGQMYAKGVDSVILLESTDGGATWARRKLGVPQQFQDMSFIDASHGWIVASDSDAMPFGPGGGSVVLRTTDGGATWQQTDLGHVSATGLTTVRFSDALHGWLFGDMVLQTTDGGVTWHDAGVDVPRSSSMRPMPVLRSAVCSGGNVWTVGANEVLLSTLDSATDSCPPVTCDDADLAWHNTDVTVHFSAFDAGSGVDHTEFHIDGVPGWTTGSAVTLEAVSDHTGDGRHTISFRSVDVAGNVESASRCPILIDTTTPETSVRAQHDATRGSRATVHFRVIDGTSPTASVTLKLVRWAHHTVTVVQTRTVGNVSTGPWHAAAVRYRVPAGTYYWVVQASDLAGNPADEYLAYSGRVFLK